MNEYLIVKINIPWLHILIDINICCGLVKGLEERHKLRIT